MFFRALKPLLPLLIALVAGCSTVSYDKGLQQGLIEVINKNGLSDAARDKRLGLSLIDISNPYRTETAGINADKMMYAASLPKIAILFALFKRIESGDIAWSQELQAKADDMIRISSNDAASDLFYQVGPDFLQSLLVSDYYRFYDLQNGGLWVGKEYGKGPAWRRDPIMNLAHTASAGRVARFYYMLERQKLVHPLSAAAMKATLGPPNMETKFVSGLKKYCPSAVMYRKAGSWRDFHSDSAIVSHGGKKYIAVALLNDPHGPEILENLIVEMDKLVGRGKKIGC